MYTRRRNSLLGVLSAVILAGLASGCGGASETKSFTLAVPAEITTVELFQSALSRAVELCSTDPKLVAVTWTFSKTDIDNPTAVEYQATPYPQRQECQAIRESISSGALNVESTTTTKSK